MTKKTVPMLYHLPLTKARINLGQLVRRVRLNKEYFILEKDGIPVVGIMGADEMEDYLELRDPAIKRQIKRSNEDFRKNKVRSADALLAEFKTLSAKRANRSRRSRA